MPCKHEGGADPCYLYANGNCKIYMQQFRRSRKGWKKGPSNHHPNPSGCRDKGAAAEHLVISELLRRGLPTGGPYNMNGPHDVFVKAAGRWLTIQVKVGKVYRNSGVIHSQHGNRLASDLLALVDLEGKAIRWKSATKDPVPEELL